MSRTIEIELFASISAGGTLGGAIAVATDGTHDADGAVRLGVELARRDGVAVALLSVVEPMPFADNEGSTAADTDRLTRLAIEQREGELAAQRARTFPSDGPWPHAIHVGHRVDEIVKHAAYHDASLIVLGLGSHGVFARLLHRETALRVIRTAAIPVIAVPSATAEVPRSAVVAIDFTPASEDAARAALDVLGGHGTLYLAHATPRIVIPQGDGRLRIHSDTQAAFFTLDNTALILDVPFGKLQLVGGTVGGGFGGKVDVTVEPITCIAAMKTGKPVKYVYDRYEEMQVSSPRAAERIYIKDGVMSDGTIVARQVTLYADAGAYSRHSPYATTKAAAHMPGPYNIPNVHIDSWCVYTNRTPSSAMRGFGVTIGDFALESTMDRIARELDLDPLQFRLKNAYRDGDMKAHHKVAEGTAIIEVIQKAAEQVGHALPDEYLAMSSKEGR